MYPSTTVLLGCIAVIAFAAPARAADRLPRKVKVDMSTLRESHPRIILTNDDLQALRKQIADNPTASAYHEEFRKHGEKLLTEKPIERVLIGPRLLDKSRKALDRVTTLALLYRLDGDRKWADRAIVEMRAAALFSDWNPSHFLDVAEMTTALAIGYDWLYDQLTPEDRVLVEKALAEKGLDQSLPVYKEARWWASAKHNWNNVCNGGMIVGALAIADDEPALAEDVLSYALASLPLALSTYAPDGAWPEGPGYWAYATRYTLFAAYALRSALGTDCAVMEHEGIRETGYFPTAMVGSTGLAFNFADAGTKIAVRPWHYALARWFNNPAYAYLAREVDEAGSVTPWDLIWFDGSADRKSVESIKRDNYFTRIQVVTLRSSWTDPEAVFVGFKGGDNKANHSHLDLGSFVLDAEGERWADDLGSDDYNMPGYFGKNRWTYYRLKTEGHNTLLLDGKNQDPKAEAPIISFVSKDDKASAVADLTAAYAPSGAVSVRRGTALCNNRSSVLVQDEIRTKEPVDVVWAMHTRASVSIDPDGSHASLTLGGKEFHAQILAPSGAKFTVEEVSLDPPQHPLKGTHKLTIHLPEKTSETTIAVVLTPGEASKTAPTVTPLENWK